MTHLAGYVGLLHRGEDSLAASLRLVADGHPDQPDVRDTCRLLAGRCDERVSALAPVAQRYGDRMPPPDQMPERLDADGLSDTRPGPVGLLRDLQDLLVLATMLQSSWVVAQQAARALRDEELDAQATQALAEQKRTISWLTTRIKVTAPQALVAT